MLVGSAATAKAGTRPEEEVRFSSEIMDSSLRHSVYMPHDMEHHHQPRDHGAIPKIPGRKAVL